MGLAGCESVDVAAGARLMCSSDSGCDGGLVCDFNYCVAPGDNHLWLKARVVPPTTSGLLAQQVPELSFATGPDLLIHLLAPVVVRGVVRPLGDTLTVNVPGELEVRADGEIKNLGYRFTAQVSNGLDENDDGYVLRVLPGRDYRGIFRPADGDLPPFSFTMTAADVASGRYEVLLPAAADYVHIAGRVRQLDYTPVGGARIVALADDDSVLGVANSESSRGFFSMTLPPGVAHVRLSVSAAADGAVFPDFVTEALDPGEDLDVRVPALPAGTEPIDAVLTVTTDARGMDGATGLTVTCVGNLAGGTLRRTATTRADGTATLHTLPGAYECLVTTANDSPFACWHGFLTLAAGADAPGLVERSIRLERRVPLFGVVRDALGKPVDGGTLLASRRVERAAGEVLAIAPPPFKATVGADGRYQLVVDPGLYDVRVTPAPETGAPPTTTPAAGVRVTAGLELPFDLPEPGIAHLTVADPDGNYLSGVTIELYWPDAPDAAGDEPPLLTKGVTGDQGFVDLLIPFWPEPATTDAR
ncbi:MAG: hypothetical protein KC635_10455 [Myxococcales bacterium]|nr:hypothetical protein [Myxococcales bacterium]MCB9736156.1 hypothetical protein [Deltaproteobacteria bacterium]